MRRSTKLALAATGAAAAAGAALLVGGALWERGTRRAVERLCTDDEAAGAAVDEPVVDEAVLATLPAPAARYLRRAIPAGAPRIRQARIEHRGEFRTAPDARWAPFRSVEHVATSPPGFVWDAAIDMVPLVGVRVRDGYRHGVGGTHGSIGGLVTIVNGRGPAIDAGALHRWLAEAPWYPTALLPGAGVRWEPVDDSTARAVVTDGDLTVSVEFTVNDRGELTRMYTPARLRDVGGTAVPTPWAATFDDWQRVDGYRIPVEGEVAWLLPEGRFAYWRGRITRVRYETGG